LLDPTSRGPKPTRLSDAPVPRIHLERPPVITTRVDIGQGLTGALASVLAFVPKLLLALVIIVVGYVVAKAIGRS